MATIWDDDRILARVEARVDGTGPGQKQIGEGQGYVVRLYDKGPADGRLDDPQLIFDSEVAHSGAGIFGAEDEAQDFKRRRLDAQLAGARQCERMTRERRDQLPALAEKCIEDRAKAKEESREATARAKVAQERQDALTREANHPKVEIDCPLRGEGWVVKAALCVTEGEEGEPRTLAELVPEQRKPPKRGRRKKPKAKAVPKSIEDALDATLAAAKPTEVPDCGGLPLKVGTRVWHVGDDFKAKVTEILKHDATGWMVEIEDEAGIPLECLSAELERRPDEDQGPDDGNDDKWPE